MTAEIPAPTTAARHRLALSGLVERASRTVPPLWSLDHFVAVNPFLGWTDRTFGDTARELRRLSGARLTMPRAFYAQALREGRVTDADLLEAAAELGVELRPADVRRRLEVERERPTPAPTVVDVASRVTGTDWAQVVTEQLTSWAAGFFDEGCASWLPAGGTPYADWRDDASVDRTPELLGAAGFRARVAELPAEPMPLIEDALAKLGVPLAQAELYLARIAASLGGWGGVAAYRRWERELRGEDDATLVELMAVRLAWEVVLLEVLGLEAAWAEARGWLAERAAPRHDDEVDLLLQRAYERAWQRRVEEQLGGGEPTIAPKRPTAQCVFCIDVRSEPFRRCLEGIAPRVETLGFAGFFGFPLAVRGIGAGHDAAHCPALLAPDARVEESVGRATEDTRAGLGLRERAARIWERFKHGAVSCFTFVGPVGLAYAPRLFTDARGWTRPGATPPRERLSADEQAALHLALDEETFPFDARVDTAEGALRGMSLTQGFSRVVALVGHGSTTRNNPYGSALDCGACGGRTGEMSARVAAEVLNDAAVRRALAARGIDIPSDTWFVAALHDTTTDEVTLFDRDQVPATHAADLARLGEQLAWAGSRTRAARAERFPTRGNGLDEAQRRSLDWSEVRPEWGLAGCGAFVAAPRARTASLDLGGRAFLHSYAWQQDEGFGTLELIMTAPLVVASWISLQYYASTVDNEVFGSGDKTLHNVVGGLGVLEGNGGGLRVGLPWQCVHDGESLVHEPMRLSAYVEAPVEAMNEVLERHPEVQALLDHGWMHLFALDEEGRVAWRYRGERRWEAMGAKERASGRDAA